MNLAWAVGLFAAIALVEGVVLHFRSPGGYRWSGFLCSLVDYGGRAWIVEVFLAFNLAMPLLLWAEQHAVARLSLGAPAAFLLCFLLEELCYYWYHRCSHRVRWFWASHKPHHIPNELTLGNAYRFGWTAVWTGSRIFYVPAVLLGVPIGAVFTLLYLNLAYQFWIHNTWMPRLGWLEYVLNTPSHHRVHHASNPEYLDANYGGVLIVFDRMFGTFVAERDDVPCIYGLVKPVYSNNPFITSFHEWGALGKDLLSASSAREFLGYLLAPPGWRPQPAGSGNLHLGQPSSGDRPL